MRVTMAASTWNISLRENAERMGHWTAVTGSNMTGSGTGDGQLCYNKLWRPEGPPQLDLYKKLSYRRETARQLRIHAQLTRCFSAVAV